VLKVKEEKVPDLKKLNPDHVKELVKIVNACPYFSLLSMEIRSIDRGKSNLEVKIQEKHLQPYGMVHGGVCASLVDAAAFWAVYPRTAAGIGLTTVEIKLNYLAPTFNGRLIARGKSIKVGKTICLGEASVEDNKGNLVAYGTSTMMVLDSVKIQGQSKLPPKFLNES
jgi:uncharacterized protein (TIGR00369 family)